MPSNKLTEIIDQIGGLVDEHELAVELLRRFGGAAGLAEWIFRGVEAAEPGSAAYAQLLRAVVELISRVSKEKGNTKFEDEIPDDDLEAAIEYAKKKAGRKKSRGSPEGTGDESDLRDDSAEVGW